PPAVENAVITFYISAGALGFAAAFFGPFVERHGPRHSLILALTLLFVGHVASFLSVHYHNYVGLHLGYGIFCGAGFGISYITPVSALLRWYPDLRGTAGGFGVCGFGLGVALWGNMYQPLIDAVGIDWFFLIFGSILCFVLLLSSFVLRTPPPDYMVGGRDVHGVKVSLLPKQNSSKILGDSTGSNDRVSPVLGDERKGNYFTVFDYQEQELGEAEILYHNKIKSLRMRQCVFSIEYILLYLVFFGAVATGIIFMSRVYSIGQNIFLQEDDRSLTRLVMYLALCNFFGRMSCPILSDAFIQVGQLNPAFAQIPLFQVVLFFLTFSYGGVIGVIPSLLTDMYGVYNSGTLHGIILTAWSICAIGGGLTFQHYYITIKDSFPTEQGRQGEIAAYTFNFHWLLVIACIGCALVPFVRTNPVDRFYPGYQYSLNGRPIAEIEAEKWIFVVPYGRGKYCLPLCAVPFQRWMLFLTAFVAQFCNGSLYAWSILNPHIDNFIQNKNPASNPPADQNAVVTFYIAAGFLGFASALFGPYVEREGPRASLLLGMTFFIYFSVHFKSYIGLYIGYGVFCGTAFGISYIAPVSALQKWYPDLRGTAGGFGVCGFAVEIDGLFLAFGGILAVLLLICSFVLRTPPPGFIVGGRDVHGVKVTTSLLLKPDRDLGTTSTSDRVSTVLSDGKVVNYVKVFDYQEQELGEAEILYHNKIKSLRIRECVFSIDFVLLYLSFLTSVATGIIFMSRVYSIGQNVYHETNDQSLTHLVTYLAVCNFLGRLLCPILSDIIIRLGQLNPAFGRKIVIGFLLVIQVVVLVLLPSLIHDASAFATFQLVLFFLTFAYGGALGIIPSLLTDLYGVYNTGTMH
ncbi:unnamed protein product, partial [Aphanomyces euteiches]